MVIGALELLAVLLLGVASLPTGERQCADVARCGPAIAAVLAFALAYAIFSGLILFAVKWLNGWPSLGADSASAVVEGGPELALTDVWSVLIALSVVAGAVWLHRQRTDGSPPDLPVRTTSVANLSTASPRAVGARSPRLRATPSLATGHPGYSLGWPWPSSW